jgi:hypothetical protein
MTQPLTSWALIDVGTERERQVERWGPQNHADGITGASALEHMREADFWRAKNDSRIATGTLTWDGILLEEIHEALAETDPQRLRVELIQVAAVAVAWAEAIDRRRDGQD